MRVAVIGGGWAGLSAAVEAASAGHDVSVFEMAARLGGRARSVTVDGWTLDNGQHILIGAYAQTLRLMERVGVDLNATFLRLPLELRYPDGSGLRLPSGAPTSAFLRAVGAYRGWSMTERLSLLAHALRWRLQGFRCDATWTVAQLSRSLPAVVRDEFIDPLCVAALNTPAAQASGAVFLRVLHDALMSGPGSADLLLPRPGLGALLPEPAAAWLQAHGASVSTGRRVSRLDHGSEGWTVEGSAFDAVILACPAAEAARLASTWSPAWAETARSLRYEPIVTVYAHVQDAALPSPMLALRSSDSRPAQYVFDHGRLSGRAGLMAMVVSGASAWIERGLQATGEAALDQLLAELPTLSAHTARVLQVVAEKRATFLCTPGLARPAATIVEGLWAAGDYVEGPYPATLEGAVRSGAQAVRAMLGRS